MKSGSTIANAVLMETMMSEEIRAMPKHERMKQPRQGMPVQDPVERGRNYDEVALGYSDETALLEALRCLQCKRPKCVEGCPVGVDIPAFIERLAEGDMPGAVHALKGDNNLPAICGRVCPQETQCEALCVLSKKREPVAIGRLERFVADWARENLPWHYDHHMGPDQNANWCVTKPWFDHVMGTRKPYLGTEKAKKDEARRPGVSGDVDHVLTTRELARMIKQAGVDFNSIGGLTQSATSVDLSMEVMRNG